MSKDKTTVTMEFDNADLCDAFFSWLCDGCGEQDFMRGFEEEGRSVSFDYHNTRVGEDGEKTYGKFLADGIVRVTEEAR